MAKANSTRRKAVASPSTKLRPYRRLEREFAKAKRALVEVSSEMSRHPKEQAARDAEEAAHEVRLTTFATVPALAEPEPELGAVLSEIAGELELARAVVQTAWQAIENLNSGEVTGLDAVLRTHADDPLAACVDRLREAIEGARLRGSRMVVSKPVEKEES